MMFHNVLRVFHDVLLCFTMFSESSNDQHQWPPIASGIATTPQGSAITPQGYVITSQKLATILLHK